MTSIPTHAFDLSSRGGDVIEGLRDVHYGETCIVCGLGPSVRAVPPELPPGVKTIGVNDAFRFRPVDYLFLIDQPIAFKNPDRIATIAESTPAYWFTGTVAHASWDYEREQRGLAPISPAVDVDSGLLPGRRITTPSLATGLALFLGFRRIGIIGIDTIGHPVLEKLIDEMNVIWSEVLSSAWLVKASIVNLSAVNAVPVLPRMHVRDFLAGAPMTHAPKRSKEHTQYIRYIEKGRLGHRASAVWRTEAPKAKAVAK